MSIFWDFVLDFQRTPWAHCLSLVIGIFIGSRLSTDKEKKEERNKVAEKFRVILINDKRRIRTNIRPDLAIQNVHAENFKTYLSWRERQGFEKAWKAYKETESQEFGKKFIGARPYYNNRARVILKLSEVIKYTKPVK